MSHDQPSPEPAETPARPDPSDGRARLLAAMQRRPSRGQLLPALLLAVLGFAAVVQVQSNSEDDAYIGARQDELIGLINSLSLASERAENEIAQLEETRNALLDDTESRRIALERARQLAGELGILAGTLPAVGPGVQITVEDPDGAVGSNHLINGIQELRDAGAEAIEFNDTVRVVAQTAVRDGAEGGVIVDGEQLRAPYVIEAIGAPDTLAGGLDIARGFIDEVEKVGGTVTVTELDSVEVASVHEPVPSEYAESAPTQ